MPERHSFLAEKVALIPPSVSVLYFVFQQFVVFGPSQVRQFCIASELHCTETSTQFKTALPEHRICSRYMVPRRGHLPFSRSLAPGPGSQPLVPWDCLCLSVCVLVSVCFPVCRASGRTSGGVSCFVFGSCFCCKVPTASSSSWSLDHAQHQSYALRQDCFAVQAALQFKTSRAVQNQHFCSCDGNRC